jgi:uncharacterized protein
MEKRNSRNPSTRSPYRDFVPTRVFGRTRFLSSGRSSDRPLLAFQLIRLLIPIFLFLIGCGAPGEPAPPSPPVPAAIGDLTARQAGDGVQLTFTLPAKTIRGERLTDPPSVEILRGTLNADGKGDEKSFRQVYAIPGTLVSKYLIEDHVQFVDPVAPDESRAHPGGTLAYRVRTRASAKRASPDSNTVFVRVFPMPQRVRSVQTDVSETAIELSWPAPTETSAGEPIDPIAEYHVYRGELDPTSADAASNDLLQAKWKSVLTLVSTSPTNHYRDTTFEFGKTYLYIVRSAVLAGGQSLESSDSPTAIVTPRDIFPPATPHDVVAAALAANSSAPLEVDLSWSINVETELAGYRVYRSEQQDAAGRLITPELLLSPAYRDTSVQPGHRYWYSVTAVDRAGNESVPSAAVAVDVTQPSS